MSLPDFGRDHLDSDGVVAAARHNDVGVALAGLDEFQVHRLHGRQVLLDDLRERPLPLHQVALKAANQANVGIRVDKHLHVEQRANPRVRQNQNAIHHDDIRASDVCCSRTASVRGEIVLGFLDRSSVRQGAHVLPQELPVDRVRVVEVDLAALVHREMRLTVVVGVHVNERHRRGAQRAGDVARDRGLARARPSGDSDQEWLHRAES